METFFHDRSRPFDVSFERDLKTKWAFEFKRGTASCNFEKKKNSVSILSYNIFSFVPITLLFSLSRIGNLFYLTISIMMLIRPDLSPFYNWIYIFQLLFFIVLYMAKELIKTYLKMRFQKQINERKVNRGIQKCGDLEEIYWKDLEVGDVVRLKKGETCPADIILLDSNDIFNKEAVCYIDCSDVDGCSSLKRKTACSLTQLVIRSSRKNNFPEYRKMLTGVIEYECPSNDTTKFFGVMKLKRDPKKGILNIDNLILRGSVIRHTGWIFGLVVHTGHDCKILKNTRQFVIKSSFLERASKFYFFISICVLALFALISTIVLVARSKDLSFILIYDSKATDTIKILTFIILYSPICPMALYGTIDFITLFDKFKVERQLRKLFSKQKDYININEPTVLPNLGHVEYVLMDKSGTITKPKLNLSQIYVGGHLYRFEKNTVKRLESIYNEKDKTSLYNYFKEEDEEDDRKNKNIFDDQDENNISERLSVENIDSRQLNENIVSPVKIFKTDLGEKNLLLHSHKQPMEEQELALERTTSSKRAPKIKLNNVEIEETDPQVVSHLTIDINKKMISKQDSSFSNSNYLVKDPSPLLKNRSRSRIGSSASPTSKNQQSGKSFEFDLKTSYLNPLAAEIFKSESDFYKDVLDKKFHVDELMKAMILCHGARVVYEGTEKKFFESYRKEEETCLKFAKCCSYIFDKGNKYERANIYSVNIRNNKDNFQILGTNEFSYSRKRFSLVVKGETDKTATLYCKGNPSALQGLMKMGPEDKDWLDSVVRNFKEKGLKCCIYTKRELSEKEAENFSKTINNLKNSLMSQTRELENVAVNMENNMEFLGIVGLKENVRKEAIDLIEYFGELNINLWILSGDTFENTMNVGFSTNILNSKMDPFFIIETGQEELLVSIRNILGEVKLVIDPYKQNFDNIRSFQKERSLMEDKRIAKRGTTIMTSKFSITNDIRKLLDNKYLVINGDSLNVILHDRYLKPHFNFLLSLMKNVIAYNLNPHHKQEFIKIIKEFSDNKTVLAIGDGYNDNLMLQSADVSIEITCEKEPYLKSRQLNHTGDIQTSSLKYIKPLLMCGKSSFDRLDSLILFLFYKEYLLAFPLFFFNWYSSFTGTKILDSIFVFCYQFAFFGVPLLINGIFDQPFRSKIVDAYSGLYLDGSHKKKNFISRFFFRGIMEAILEGVLVFYFSVYMVGLSLSEEGTGVDFGIVSAVIAVCLMAVPNFKLAFTCSSHKVYFAWIGWLFAIAVYVCFVLTTDRKDLILLDYETLYTEIVKRANCLMTVAFVTWLCCLISFLINYYLLPIINPSLYEYFAGLNNVSNKEIITSQFNETSLSFLVKNIFKNAKFMDNIIQEMLNPSDVDLVDLRLHRFTLKIIDKTLNHKYSHFRTKKNIRLMRILYILILLIFGGYSLADTLTADQGCIFQSRPQPDEVSMIGFVRLGVFLFFLGYWLLMMSPIFERYYVLMSSFIIFCGVVAVIGFQWSTCDYKIGLSCALVSIITTLNLNLNFLFIVFINFAFYANYLAKLAVFYYDKFDVSVPNIEDVELFRFFIICSFVILLIAMGFLHIFILYEDEKLKRNDYLAQSSLEYEKNIRQDILSILVPKFVKNSINQGELALQQEQDDVVILFCDICDFDKIIASKGRHIVEILDELFRKYDSLCINHGIQKIETVGKTYMACAGIKNCEQSVPSHILQIEKTRRIVNAAFDMMAAAETSNMTIKIGVHVGKIIAGVIGYHKPQFSLIGDTVNTTSRLCSTGEDSKITISFEAYERIRISELFFVPRHVEAKGKGNLLTYQVLKQPTEKSGLFKNKIGKAMKILQDLRKNDKKPLYEESINNIAGHEKAKMIINRVFGRTSTLNDHFHNNTTNNETNPLTQKALLQKQTVMEKEKEPIYSEDDDNISDYSEEDTKYQYVHNNKLLMLTQNQEGNDLLFYDDLKKNTVNMFKVLLIAFCAVYLFQTLIIISIKTFIANYLVILLIRGAAVILVIISFILVRDIYKSLIFKLVLLSALVACILLTVIQGYNSKIIELNTVQLLEMTLLFVFISYLPPLPFIAGLFLFCLSTLLFLLIFGTLNFLDPEHCFYFFTFSCLHLMKLYYQKRYVIKSYNNLQQRAFDKIEQEALVSQLLPTHAFEKLKNINVINKLDLTDEFDDVTLLFADIAGFTKYSSSVTANQVVFMLRSLFTEFDKCCLRYKVYKVYTIGDCYVVMGFTNAARRNPVEEAKNVVKMGLSMIEIIRQERDKVGFKDLDMRIGIHTGRVIGGIIGTDIVRYDIYGKDVVLANKMESNGLEGNIMVSESTKNMIERDKNSGFKFDFRKKVECKAMDHPVDAYLILRKNEDNLDSKIE